MVMPRCAPTFGDSMEVVDDAVCARSNGLAAQKPHVVFIDLFAVLKSVSNKNFCQKKNNNE